jgi:hypothetical protein
LPWRHYRALGVRRLLAAAGQRAGPAAWQHTRGWALLGFVRDDAAYLASRITTTAPAAQPAPQPAA